MRMLKEILRLFLFCGLSFRQISRSTRVARSTVADYVWRAQKAGLQWEQCKDVPEQELERMLFPIPAVTKGLVPVRPVPDCVAIHDELRRDKNVTLTLLWHEYREQHPDGYSLSQFHWLYSQWSRKLGLVMRQVHRAGEKLFVDFCDGPVIINESGEGIKTQIFVAVWGASNYTFVRAVGSQDLPNWIGCHVAAFNFFGCVPHITVPDNLRSAVSKACRYEPDLNPTYHDMSQHYGTVVIPARARHPRDKAKAEAGVLLVQRWILAALRKHVFHSLIELNAAIEPLLQRLNDKQLRVFKRCRRELFETLDRPAALSLPSAPYEYASWKKATVGPDYHMLIDDHYYSVPYSLVGEEVDIRLTTNVVEVLFGGGRVASHQRSYVKGGKTTCPEHMPRSHREHAGLNLEVILLWAAKTGTATAELFEKILERQHQSESAFHSLLGIYRLSSRYGRERIEKAAIRALAFGSCSYRSMKRILSSKLDQQLLKTNEGSPQTVPLHDNIRGKQYFGKEVIPC